MVRQTSKRNGKNEPVALPPLDVPEAPPLDVPDAPPLVETLEKKVESGAEKPVAAVSAVFSEIKGGQNKLKKPVSSDWLCAKKGVVEGKVDVILEEEDSEWCSILNEKSLQRYSLTLQLLDTTLLRNRKSLNFKSDADEILRVILPFHWFWIGWTGIMETKGLDLTNIVKIENKPHDILLKRVERALIEYILEKLQLLEKTDTFYEKFICKENDMTADEKKKMEEELKKDEEKLKHGIFLTEEEMKLLPQNNKSKRVFDAEYFEMKWNRSEKKPWNFLPRMNKYQFRVKVMENAMGVNTLKAMLVNMDDESLKNLLFATIKFDKKQVIKQEALFPNLFPFKNEEDITKAVGIVVPKEKYPYVPNDKENAVVATIKKLQTALQTALGTALQTKDESMKSILVCMDNPKKKKEFLATYKKYAQEFEDKVETCTKKIKYTLDNDNTKFRETYLLNAPQFKIESYTEKINTQTEEYESQITKLIASVFPGVDAKKGIERAVATKKVEIQKIQFEEWKKNIQEAWESVYGSNGIKDKKITWWSAYEGDGFKYKPGAKQEMEKNAIDNTTYWNGPYGLKVPDYIISVPSEDGCGVTFQGKNKNTKPIPCKKSGLKGETNDEKIKYIKNYGIKIGDEFYYKPLGNRLVCEHLRRNEYMNLNENATIDAFIKLKKLQLKEIDNNEKEELYSKSSDWPAMEIPTLSEEEEDKLTITNQQKIEAVSKVKTAGPQTTAMLETIKKSEGTNVVEVVSEAISKQLDERQLRIHALELQLKECQEKQKEPLFDRTLFLSLLESVKNFFGYSPMVATT
jgi:hypothetical protein